MVTETINEVDRNIASTFRPKPVKKDIPAHTHSIEDITGLKEALVGEDELQIPQYYDVAIWSFQEVAYRATGGSGKLNIYWGDTDDDNFDITLHVNASSHSLTFEDDAIISQDYSVDSTSVKFGALRLDQQSDSNALNIYGYDDMNAEYLKAYIDSAGESYLESSDTMHFYGTGHREFYFETDQTGSNLLMQLKPDPSYSVQIQGKDTGDNTLGFIYMRGSGHASAYNLELHAGSTGDVVLKTNDGGNMRSRITCVQGGEIQFGDGDSSSTIFYFSETGGHPYIRAIGTNTNFKLRSDAAEFDFEDDQGTQFWSLNQYAMTLHGAGTLSIPDANATAFIIQEGANPYITFNTSDGAERITLHKDVYFTNLYTTQLYVDHIGENTGSHNVVFDNNAQFDGSINLGSFTDANDNLITIATASGYASGFKGEEVDGYGAIFKYNGTDNKLGIYKLNVDAETAGILIDRATTAGTQAYVYGILTIYTGLGVKISQYGTGAGYPYFRIYDNTGVTYPIELHSNATTFFNTGNNIEIRSGIFKVDHIAEYTGSHTITLDDILLATDAIYFTQSDGAEKIDSAADGYLDLYAGTAIRANDDLDVLSGKLTQAHTTLSAAGPTDNLDVGAVNVVEVDISGNDVTLGGFTNGVQGQTLRVVVVTLPGAPAMQTFTIEHNEGTGNQDIFLHSSGDESTQSYEGWLLYCDGSKWIEIDN